MTILEIKQDTAREQYKNDYVDLQKYWRSESKELLLVGKLAYWSYWLSYYAGKSKGEEQKRIYALKNKAISLLNKSKYVHLEKYSPSVHKSLCKKHYKMMKSQCDNAHYYIWQYKSRLSKCEDCQKGVDHYFSLYVLTIFDRLEGEEKKPQYILYSPYPVLKDRFPELDKLTQFEKFKPYEFGKMSVSQDKSRKIYEDVFSLNLVIKKLKESYLELKKFFVE